MKLLFAPSLVAAKIIQNDDVSWFQGFEKLVSDISLEGLAVDWPIEHPWCVDPVTAQRGQEGHRLPMAMRHMGDEPLAAGTPATQRRHVGFDPGSDRRPRHRNHARQCLSRRSGEL